MDPEERAAANAYLKQKFPGLGTFAIQSTENFEAFIKRLKRAALGTRGYEARSELLDAWALWGEPPWLTTPPPNGQNGDQNGGLIITKEDIGTWLRGQQAGGIPFRETYAQVVNDILTSFGIDPNKVINKAGEITDEEARNRVDQFDIVKETKGWTFQLKAGERGKFKAETVEKNGVTTIIVTRDGQVVSTTIAPKGTPQYETGDLNVVSTPVEGTDETLITVQDSTGRMISQWRTSSAEKPGSDTYTAAIQAGRQAGIPEERLDAQIGANGKYFPVVKPVGPELPDISGRADTTTIDLGDQGSIVLYKVGNQIGSVRIPPKPGVTVQNTFSTPGGGVRVIYSDGTQETIGQEQFTLGQPEKRGDDWYLETSPGRFSMIPKTFEPGIKEFGGREFFQQETGQMQLLPREYEPGIVGDAGRQLLQQPTGQLSLIPERTLDQIIAQALVDGDFDKALAFQDFQQRPTAKEAFDAALSFARSPADQQLISSIARGETPVAPPPPGTVQRIGPQPDFLVQAYNEFQQRLRGGRPPTPEEQSEYLQRQQTGQTPLTDELQLKIQKQSDDNQRQMDKLDFQKEESQRNYELQITTLQNQMQQQEQQYQLNLAKVSGTTLPPPGKEITKEPLVEDETKITDTFDGTPNGTPNGTGTTVVDSINDVRSAIASMLEEGGVTNAAASADRMLGRWTTALAQAGLPPVDFARELNRYLSQAQEIFAGDVLPANQVIPSVAKSFPTIYSIAPGGAVSLVEPTPTPIPKEVPVEPEPSTVEQITGYRATEPVGGQKGGFVLPGPTKEPSIATGAFLPTSMAEAAVSGGEVSGMAETVSGPPQFLPPGVSQYIYSPIEESRRGAFGEAFRKTPPPSFGLRFAGEADEFAGGGVTDTDVALVGEKGPELALFPVGTHILPLGKANPADIRRAQAKGKDYQTGGIVFPTGIRQIQAGRPITPPRGYLSRAAGLTLPSAQAFQNITPGSREVLFDVAAQAGIPKGEFAQELIQAFPGGQRLPLARTLPFRARGVR